MKSRFAVAVILSLLFIPSAFADIVDSTFNIRQLTADTDIVSANANYIFAINFWSQNVGTEYTVNDVKFNTVNGGTATYGTAENRFVYQPQTTVTGVSNHAGNNSNLLASGDLNNILTGMIFNGGQKPNTTVKLNANGLEVGKTYTLSLLGKAWTTGDDNRLHTFSFDSNLDGVADDFILANTGTAASSFTFSEDNPSKYWSGIDNAKPYAVDYTFTAQSNTIQMSDLGLNDNNAWHLYGASLYEHTDVEKVTAPEAVIANGSFEADIFVQPSSDGNHGYINNYNYLISGWALTGQNKNQIGLTPTWSDYTQTTPRCGDFLNNNQTATDGKQTLFIQHNAGNQINGVEQVVSGFNTADDIAYRLSMDVSMRTGYGKPELIVTLDGKTIGQLKITEGKFRNFSTFFNADNVEQTIGISNSIYNGSDATLLVDNVKLTPVKLFTQFTDNFSVLGNEHDISLTTNNASDRFGGTLAGSNGFSYKTSSSQTHLTQVGHPSNPGALLIATNRDNATTTEVIDHNFMDDFKPSEEGTLYTLSFSTAPACMFAGATPEQWTFTGTTITDWSAVMFGTSGDASKTVNNTDGVGMLFRRNGGIQIFDGTNTNGVVADLGAGTIGLDENGWADFMVQYIVRDFDDLTNVDVSLFAKTTGTDDYEHIYSFTTAKGFDNNFISLAARSTAGGGTYVYSFFDNVSLKSSAVPEPSTWAMLLLGLAGIGYIRRKTRRV